MTRPTARESEAGFILPSTIQQRIQAAHRRPASQDPAWRIWKTLNPDEEPLIHLRLEVPTVVAFQSDTRAKQGYEYAPGPARPFSLVFGLFKFIVLPIIGTVAVLYGLLLHLLKDAELLEAQRNRAEADAPPPKEKPLDGQASFKTLPRAFPTDVELLASSKDSEVIAAVGLQNELSIWHFNDPNPVVIDTSDVLLSTASTSFSQERIATVALDDAGEYCAVGTTCGTIGVWFMAGRSVRLYATLPPHSISMGIRELHFAPPLQSVLKQKNGPHSRPCTPPPGPPEPEPLLVVYENGAMAQWIIDDHASASFISPMSSEPILQSRLLRVRLDDRILVAFVLADGALEVLGICEARSAVPIRCALQPGNSADRVSRVDACKVRLDGRDHIIIGVASELGVISLWDAGSSECISILEDNHGAIDQLRISNSCVVNCQFCGEPPLDSFMVSVSIGNTVVFYKVYVRSQERRCTCPRNNPQESTILELATGRRSRSNSIASTGPSVPSTRRLSSASIVPAPDTAFPVSGHGILSRRASEKGLRRLSESYVLPNLTGEDDEGHSIHIDPPIISRPSTWSNVAVLRAGEAGCERGGWDAAGEKIIGVRRITRARTKGAPQLPASSTSRGLTPAVLDRWEVWLFDTGIPAKKRSAAVSSLTDEPPISLRRSFLPSMYLSRPPSPTAVAQDEYPRLPFTRVSPFLAVRGAAMAGFGNTVGLFLVS
jgi:hypothetical protein